MNGWENFLVGELGASGALTGLVFVGVSINLTKIMSSSSLINRALEALIALVVVLFSSSLLLIPGQSGLASGIEVLLIGVLDWMAMLILQLQTLRKVEQQYRGSFARLSMPSQMAALSFVIAGIVFLIFGTGGLYWIVAATLLSFLAAFIDSWVLLIEINR
jgi:uncharacterized integral membrane protein